MSRSGPAVIDDSKLKKNILARGADELVMVADDAYIDMDAYATAAALASAIDGLDGWDVIVCGDGSADNYAQQVDVQLAYKLGARHHPRRSRSPRRTPASAPSAGSRTSSRSSSFPMPCVVSVLPDIALPRIPA